jgi:ankyrin repeat protein
MGKLTTVNTSSTKPPEWNQSSPVPKSDDVQKRPATSIRVKNCVSPVTLLRSLLKEQSTQSLNKTCHESFFSKPDENDVTSYDLELVNAIRAKDIDTLRTLHKEGKSMNACNRFGESLLHMCCRRGDAELVKFLVEEIGVRTNIKDDYGRTPLHDACWRPTPNFEIMEILIKNSHRDLLLAADVRGHTPFDYARKEHWGAWVKFFAARRELLTK